MIAHIVYATITGNNQDIAEILGEELENLGVDVEIDDIAMQDISFFEDANILVVCPYTYDEGNLPDEGLDFFDEITEADLSGKTFGVAGSGDEFYGEYFCTAVDKFADQLEKAGAIKGTDNVKINLAPDNTEDIDRLADFAKKLVESAKKN